MADNVAATAKAFETGVCHFSCDISDADRKL
jgi:hypothetical protein